MNRFDNNFIQNTKKDIKDEKRRLDLFWVWSIPLYIILIFFLIFFTWYTVFTTTHSYYLVRGASMKNTFNSEISDTDSKSAVDAVYVNTNDTIRLFDAVVIEKDGNDAIIKRVMAQEGDYITIIKGEYDGVACFYFCRISAKDFAAMSDTEKTEYVDQPLIENSGAYTIKDYKDWKATSSTQYDFLGKTYEKKFFDTFEIADYDAGSEEYFRASTGVIYRRVPKGKIFCLGDNRAHSQDSRFDGFYNLKDVVGRVEIIIYNQNFGNRFWGVIKYYFVEIEKFFAR